MVNRKPKKISHWWEKVPPIVPGQEVFSSGQMRLLLGGMSKENYDHIVKCDLLRSSRLSPTEKKIVHTIEQYRDYVQHLNDNTVPSVSAATDMKVLSKRRRA